MVNINKKRLAFTIAEALVSMLILSIFIGLSMKIFTKKHTKPIYNPSHGYYMCYRDITNGRVYEKIGTAAPVVQRSGGAFLNYCDFTPVQSASYYVIYAVGGGGGGGASVGGAPGEFMTLFVTNIADSIRIFPGAAGNANSPGGGTRVVNLDNDELLSVGGGVAGGTSSIRQDFIRGCKVVPLASFLDNDDNRDFLNNNSADSVSCEIKTNSLLGRICPRANADIRQEDQIYSFYNNYAAAALRWASGSQNAFDANNGIDWRDYYRIDGDCIVGQNELQQYCLDRAAGDKYYERASASMGWSLSGTSGNNNCREVEYLYEDIGVDSDTDTTTVIRSKDNLKFILDLYYDMSALNGTRFIKRSSFGEYIENSALKDDTTMVLFDRTARANTSNVVARQFDPSMGDGGYQGSRGYPGAVFIAW